MQYIMSTISVSIPIVICVNISITNKIILILVILCQMTNIFDHPFRFRPMLTEKFNNNVNMHQYEIYTHIF